MINRKQQLFDLLQKLRGIFKATYQQVQKPGDMLYLLQTKLIPYSFSQL